MASSPQPCAQRAQVHGNFASLNWVAITFLWSSRHGYRFWASCHNSLLSAGLHTWSPAATCLHPISAWQACHRVPYQSAHLPTRYSSPERHQMLQCPMLGTGPRVFTSFSSLMTSLHSGGLVSVDQLWSRQLVNIPGISAVAITAFLMTSKPWPWEGGSPLKSVLP